MERVGVFTNSYSSAEAFITRYEKHSVFKTIKKKFSKNEIFVEFANGDYIKWIRPIEMSRGNKVTKAYINLDIKEDEYQNIILPMCIMCEPCDIVRDDLNEVEFDMCNDDRLKPCPFCGNRDIDTEWHHGWWGVTCKRCTASIGDDPMQEDDAIRAWNMRLY